MHLLFKRPPWVLCEKDTTLYIRPGIILGALKALNIDIFKLWNRLLRLYTLSKKSSCSSRTMSRSLKTETPKILPSLLYVFCYTSSPYHFSSNMDGCNVYFVSFLPYTFVGSQNYFGCISLTSTTVHIGKKRLFCIVAWGPFFTTMGLIFTSKP